MAEISNQDCLEAIERELNMIEMTLGNFQSATEATQSLINWHCIVQIDPEISSDANYLFMDGFEAGWRAASRWSDRGDLISDIGSPAYIQETANAIRSRNDG